MGLIWMGEERVQGDPRGPVQRPGDPPCKNRHLLAGAQSIIVGVSDESTEYADHRPHLLRTAAGRGAGAGARGYPDWRRSRHQ